MVKVCFFRSLFVERGGAIGEVERGGLVRGLSVAVFFSLSGVNFRQRQRGYAALMSSKVGQGRLLSGAPKPQTQPPAGAVLGGG